MKKLKTLYQQSAKVRHSQQHFAKLEKAHQSQAAYIQNLQTENQKIEVYKSTIRTQERVVAKLEELIETKLKDRKDGGTSTTFRLKQEITRLTQRNQELLGIRQLSWSLQEKLGASQTCQRPQWRFRNIRKRKKPLGCIWHG